MKQNSAEPQVSSRITFKRTREAMLGNQNIMLMDSAEAMVDCVTPYAIRNLTNFPIFVKSLQEGLDSSESECKIEEGQMKGLAVSFAETLNMSQRDTSGKKYVVSKDQFVQINFE